MFKISWHRFCTARNRRTRALVDRFGVPDLHLLLNQVANVESMLDPDDTWTDQFGDLVARLYSIAHVEHMMFLNAITTQFVEEVAEGCAHVFEMLCL